MSTLKKLGYFSYLLGIEGIIFVLYIFVKQNVNNRIEPLLILFGIVVVSLLFMLFVTYSLKTLEHRKYQKTGTIDEYLSVGMEDDQIVKQLPLFWKIIGWMAIVVALGVALVSSGFLLDYVFSRWKKYDIYSLYALTTLASAIVAIIYSLRVVNRKWIGTQKSQDNL